MPTPDPNNIYIQPPSDDEDPETKMITVSKMVATRNHQPWRDILSVLNRCLTGKDSSWDTDEFEWQTVERSTRPLKMSKLLYTRFTKLIIDYILSHDKSIPRRSDSKLHSSQDDHPITKLLNITNGDYKFGMEVPDAMISDVIKKKAGYRIIWQRKWKVRKLKLLMNQKSNAYLQSKVEEEKDLYSDATLKSSSLEESAGETGDADKSDMDLSDDNLDRDDEAVRYGVFMHNKPFATPNSTYLSLTVISSSLDIIQTLLEDTPTKELTYFMSHSVYTNAQTTLVVHNPEGNP
ncbi:hypothetical protein Tco_1290896 [Tanacetum coccineum]